MPDYRVTFFFNDSFNGETTRSYEGTFTDDAAATTAADALSSDINSLCDIGIDRYELAKIVQVGSAAPANSLVFNTVQATVNLVGKPQKATLSLPMPNATVMPANALVTTATDWTNFIANFAAGLWTISDGDNIDDTVSGKRVIRRSGKTNLPSS